MQTVKLNGVMETPADTGENGGAAIVEVETGPEMAVDDPPMRIFDETGPRPPPSEVGIPVEGLAEGVSRLLGDGVGVLVASGRKMGHTLFQGKGGRNRAKPDPRTIATDSAPPAAEVTAYMGGRVVHGVRDIGQGSTGIIRGAGTVLFGAVTVVSGSVGCVIEVLFQAGNRLTGLITIGSADGHRSVKSVNKP